jgi:hypothetical protein
MANTSSVPLIYGNDVLKLGLSISNQWQQVSSTFHAFNYKLNISNALYIRKFIQCYILQSWLNIAFSAVYVIRGCTKNFRTGRLEREPQITELSATRWSCIAILWVSLVSFAATTLCAASQRVMPKVSVYFVMTQSGNFWIHPRMRWMALCDW